MSMELAINLDLLHRLDQLDHWRNQPAHSQGFHLDPLLPMPFPMAMGCFGIGPGRKADQSAGQEKRFVAGGGQTSIHGI